MEPNENYNNQKKNVDDLTDGVIYAEHPSRQNNSKKGAHIDAFFDKLDNSTKLLKTHANDVHTQKFRIFNSTEKNLGVKDFLDLYRPQHTGVKPKGEITIITIIKNDRNKTDDATAQLEDLLYSILKQHNEPEKYFLDAKSPCLKVECIKMEHLSNYDAINATIGNIRMVLDKADDLVIESLYDICFAIYKEKMIAKFSDLLRPLNEDHAIKIYDSEEGMEIRSKIFLNRIIDDIVSCAKSFTMFSYAGWESDYLTSILNLIHKKVLDYENEIDFLHFTVKPKELAVFLKNLIKERHKKAFGQCLRDLLPLVVDKMVKPNSYKIFADTFRSIYRNVIEDLKSENANFGSLDYIGLGNSKYLQNLQYKPFCISKYEEYYNYLNFDEIQMANEQMYIENDNRPIKKCLLDSVTKIIFDEKITYKSLSLLYHILKEINIFDASNFQQMFYIDVNILTDWQNFETGAIISTMVKGDLASGPKYISTSKEMMEHCLMTRTKNTDSSRDKFISKTVRKDAAKHVKKQSLSRFDSDKLNGTIVLTEFYEDLVADGHVEILKELEDLCIDKDKYETIKKRKVTVVLNSKPSYIYIIYQGSEIAKIEKVSIIYDIYIDNDKYNSSDLGCPSRRIKCHDNAPLLFMDNLLCYLQFIQLTPCTQFEIPNTWTMKGKDYAYSETIFEKNSQDTSFNFIMDVLKRSYALQKSCYGRSSLCLYTIAKHFDNNGYGSYGGVIMFCQKTGISEAELLRFLCKFMLKSNYITDSDDRINAIKKYDKLHDVELILTRHQNDNKLIHLCEIQGTNYIRYLMSNITALLIKLLESTKVYNAIQDENPALNSISARKNIITCVVNNLCKKMQFDSKLCCSGDIEMDNKEFIQNLLAEIKTKTGCEIDQDSHAECNTGSSILSETAPDDGLIDAVAQYAEIASKELDSFARKEIVKVTSIKLLKPKVLDKGTKGKKVASALDFYEDVSDLTVSNGEK